LVFWIIYCMRAKKGHEIDGMMIIKLFSDNYTRFNVQEIYQI
jgi:hypothetical protein